MSERSVPRLESVTAPAALRARLSRRSLAPRVARGVLLAALALGTNFPWGTFLINISGSLVMGLLAGYFAFASGASWTQNARLFALTGILGGYTTFSAFSLDAALLFERGELGLCLAYVGGSVALALAGVFGGLDCPTSEGCLGSERRK